jgi:membrane-associated protease RseP (regulator of RpoE activity)
VSLGIILFIVAILVVVMVHEAGHFLVAKLFGFKATKFFVGFGPKVWSVQKGETEYGIAAIPAGGFVKIVGMNPYEEVAPEDVPRSYPNKPRWQRALLLVAGSATHWVVAFVVLLVTTMTIGFPTGDASTEVAEVQTRVEGLAPPAVAAGLEPGDRIVSVAGEPTPDWDAVTNTIRAHPGESIALEVERDGERVELQADLWAAVFDEQRGPVEFAETAEELREPRPTEEVGGFLGFTPSPEMERQGLFGGIVDSGKRVGELTVLSVKGIGQVFGMVFGGELWDALTGEGEREVDEGPLGLVGASRIAGESVQRGEILNFIGLIVGFTVFVGLMNLLPLPPLDGGHLAVLAYEKVTGRAVDIRKLIPIAAAVISFFVVLFIAVLYLDLARPVRVPF